MGRRMFCGDEFGFRWTPGNWYEYDGPSAEKKARQARDAFAKELAARGEKPRKGSLGSQLVSKGGIGSGRPHIELYTKCFYVNW